MARTMSKVVPVKIVRDEINCYATIQRSMMAAITACMRLSDNEKMEELNAIRQWANDKFNSLVEDKSNECGNPALG